MKRIIQLAILLCFPLWMSAQDCPSYYPLKNGNTWEVSNYDKKDKLQGSNAYTVTSVTTSANGYEAVVNTVSKDDKGEVLGNGDLVMKCLNGVFYFDMKNFLDQATLEQYKEMDVTMTATDMEFPATLVAGTTLPDASITYQVSSNGMKIITMVINITDRKVVGKESITVPAGTFEVWKMTSKTSTKMGFMNTKISSIEYMSTGSGMIRSETYNEKDALIGYSVLTKISAQ